MKAPCSDLLYLLAIQGRTQHYALTKSVKWKDVFAMQGSSGFVLPLITMSMLLLNMP